ncbi:MAG: rhodanese-like domain-containing protein [Candidatus Saccharibacteria bacterium]
MDRIIIDVREPEEYDRGHVSGAINIPPGEIMAGASKLADVPKDTELVLYCVSGSRSNVSMQYLQRLGFTNLVNGINQHHVTAKYLS